VIESGVVKSATLALIAVLLCLCASAQSAPAPGTSDQSDLTAFFPLAPGLRWEYSGPTGQKLVVETYGPEKVGGVQATRFDYTMDGVLVQREWYAAGEAGIVRLRSAFPKTKLDVKYSPPVPFLKPPLEYGKSWQYAGTEVIKSGKNRMRVAVKALCEVILTSEMNLFGEKRRTFTIREQVKARQSGSEHAVTVDTTVTLAEGVGVVRHNAQGSGLKTNASLLSFGKAGQDG